MKPINEIDPIKKKIRHKFGANRTERDGQKFDSQKEAKFYDLLKLQERSGDVLFFLRQTPFHLPGNVICKVDFQVFYPDGRVEFVDVKGMKTRSYVRNKKMIETLYPVEIIEV